jgi:geranylgeranyl pyrophosphate synthase
MASAIEMIHAFSLIHDDLPAIDDDDLRRGKPSCHKKFDEATAIMAGDALIALAIEILSQEYGLELNSQRKIINIISYFMGSNGLIGGEMLDIEITKKRDITINYLREIYLLKTGKLLSASVQIGALASGCDDAKILDNLNKYSENIGLAFQIHDDILDVTQPTEILGKKQGSDIELGKITYPSLMGLDQSKKIINDLHDEALEALQNTGYEFIRLKQIAKYIISRSY